MSPRRVLILCFVVAAVSSVAIASEMRVASLREKVQAQEAKAMGEPDTPAPQLQYPAKPMQQTDTMVPNAAEDTVLKAYITPEEPLKKGVASELTLALKDKDGKPVTIDTLEERHTRKIHLLVIDEALGDYHHLHPTPGKNGTYTFSFTPATAHNYKVFADVKPVGGDAEMVPVALAGRDACSENCIDKKSIYEAKTGDITAKLEFDQKSLKVGTPAKGDVLLTDAKGAPVKNLEPVMGAYAHIVGFYDNFMTVAHMHPLGDEPKDAKERGASPVKFMLHPQRAGFLKLFVQIHRDGKDVFIPFGVTVGD